MQIEITQHAYKRIKQRAKIKNRNCIERLACEAFDRGTRMGQASSSFANRLIAYHSKKVGREICLFNDKIFVWEGITLVTMYPAAPSACRRLAKIRNKQKKHVIFAV